MAWYDVYDYENESDMYIREEQKQSKRINSGKMIGYMTESMEGKAGSSIEDYMSPKPEPYTSQTNLDPIDAESQYRWNKAILFKDIKEPNFSSIEVVKTVKPTASFGSQMAMLGASPLMKPIKVYKFKAVDTSSGAEVITAQKEIEVVGENQHNYFYITKDGVKSINKAETSATKLDNKDLRLRYVNQMNKQAKSMARNGMLVQEFKPAPEKSLFQKAGDFLGEVGDTVTAGVAGFGNALAAPFNALIDLAVQRNGKYAHDPRYFEEIKLKFDKDGNVLSEYKKNAEKLDNLDQYETEDFPKGWSRETDAMAAGKSKEEIAAAREEDKNATIAMAMKKGPGYKLSSTEKTAVVVGEVAEMIGEFVVLGGLGKVVTAGTKSKIIAKTLEAAVTGGGIGFLDKLRERDAKAQDYAKEMLKQTIFLGVGAKTSKIVGKAVGPTEGLFKTLGKRALTGAAFGAGGTAASYPLMEEEEKSPGNLAANIGLGAAMEVGGTVAAKGLKKTLGLRSKGATPLPEAKVKELKASTFDRKYGLNRPIKEIPVKERVKVANETTKVLLNDIGENIGKDLGTKNPKKVLDHYVKKYQIKGKVSLDGTLRGEGNYARVEIKPNGDIEVRINKSKTDNEIVAAIRHEIEHLRLPKSTVKPGKKMKPQTLREFMNKPGHQEGHQNFEIEYLENISKNRAFAAADRIEVIKSQLGNKNISAAKRQRLIDEGKVLNRNLKSRERMNLGEMDSGTSFENERIHARNREISSASNLPVYEPKSKTSKEKAKDLFDRGYATFINKQQAIDKTGKKVMMTSQNYSKYHGTADHITTSNLVSRSGDAIGSKSIKSVLKAPKGLQAEFDSYLYHKHHLDRMVTNLPNAKNPGKPVLFNGKKVVSVEDTQNAIAEYERMFPEFKKASEDLYQFTDDFMREWAVDGGLMTEREYKAMRKLYPNYVPTQRELNEMIATQSKGPVGVKAVGKAVGGEQTLKPLGESMPGYVQNIVRAQRRNAVHQELLSAVIENPKAMQEFAEVYQVNPKTKMNKATGKAEVVQTRKEIRDKVSKFEPQENESLTEVSSRFNETVFQSKTKGDFVVVMDSGKPITLKINDKSLFKALQEMQGAPVSGLDQVATIFNKHITSKFKGVISVYNPFFAVKNIVKDIPTAYTFGSVSNPITYTKNLFKSFGSIMKKDEMYKKFQGLGISTANITKAERTMVESKKSEKVVNNILEVLNWFGSVSETVPRLAEFKATYARGVKKGLPEAQVIQEAIYNAGEVTVNFSRGGKVTKKMDAFFPYINAGSQGMDRWIRGLVTNGVAKGNFKPLVKALGVSVVPSVALGFINRTWMKDKHKDIPNYVKDAYYIFPVGDNTYAKAPKSRENGFLFSTIFERLHRHFIENDPKAFDGLTESAFRSFFNPIAEVSGGGIAWPVLNLKGGGNKDFFGRNIEPLSKQLEGGSKRYITKENTSKASKAIAPLLEKFGISPAQSDYLIKSYGGIVADFVLNINDSEETLTDKLKRSTHLFHDTRYSSQSSDDAYKEKDTAKREIVDFEYEKGIKDLRAKLKAAGETSTNTINSEIKNLLGSEDWDQYQSLKKYLKEMDADD